MIKVVIRVEGLSLLEADENLEDLRTEIKERPWLVNPSLTWDEESLLLIVEVAVAGEDPKLEAEGVIDEIADCVIATIHFSSERISFSIDKAEIVHDG